MSGDNSDRIQIVYNKDAERGSQQVCEQISTKSPRVSQRFSILKWGSLVFLTVQTSALTLTLRYSRTQPVDTHRYIASTAVALSEVVKLITCIVVLLVNHKLKIASLHKEFDEDVVGKWCETLKMIVPAVCYVLQNNLLFLALSKLDAATYQVTYQLKILTTAFFSVSILGQKLNGIKWIALVLLTTGVALEQLPSSNNSDRSMNISSIVETVEDSSKVFANSDRMIGLLAVLVACISSGFAGVYFEKLLKGTTVSLWMRNLELAFFSVFCAFIMVLVYDVNDVIRFGFFVGYNQLTWIIVFLQAYLGLAIALVVRYADNIMKGFAVSLSIILSGIVSYFLLHDFRPTILFAVGAMIVVGSTFLYTYDPSKSNKKQPT